MCTRYFNNILILHLSFYLWLQPLTHIYNNNSPKDKRLSVGHGISSHHLLASDLSPASAAQVVNSIVDAGVAHMATSSGISSSSLLSPLDNPSDATNNVIRLLNTTNNPDSFHTSNAHNVSANLPHSLPPPPPQLTQTQPVDTLEHGSRSGISLLQTQHSGGESSNSISFTTNENHSHNHNPSPTGRIENAKVESLENGGEEHSPKYISL